jgi:NosR/NirI family transcriptional regulator, nitrous oxide reductase regulator
MSHCFKKIFSNRQGKSRVRILTAALLALILLGILAGPALACNITASPATGSGVIGDILNFTVSVQLEHRNCTVPIEQTQIKLSGLEMVSQSPWQKINTLNYKKQITVKIKDAGASSIEVIRECPKGGGYAVIKVTGNTGAVTQAVPAAAPTSLAAAPTSIAIILETPQPVSELSQTKVDNDKSVEKNFAQALAQGLTEPYIIALVVLIVLSTIILVKRFLKLRSLILLASLVYLGFLVGGCPCGLGSLQNIIIKVGAIKDHIPAYLQIGILLLSAVLLGRLFCGWVCPMGAVQNFLYRREIGKKTRKFTDRLTLNRRIRYLKYFVLASLIISALVTNTALYASIDPFKALFNFDFSLLIPTILLVVLLISSLFMGFPWCKYICPMGALLSIFSRFALLKLKISDKCGNCGACHNLHCEHGAIMPGETKPEINQMECVRCGECLSHCPRAAISLGIKNEISPHIKAQFEGSPKKKTKNCNNLPDNSLSI